MNRVRPERIVILGMMSKMPVAGVVWQTLHYLVGFERLGYEVYYVEAHARTPTPFVTGPGDDGSAAAAAFIARTMERFGFADRWAFHALHADCRCYGLDERTVQGLYRTAALIVNLHGGTKPRAEHCANSRLVYLETDPVEVQVALSRDDPETIAFLSAHQHFFTFAENYGKPGCQLPYSDRFAFLPTRQPIVLDFWRSADVGGACFTTIGNWRQPWRQVVIRGQTYHWSKHLEFQKFLELPERTAQPFELALSSCTAEERQMLTDRRWRVCDALDLSSDLDTYRRYIVQSRGEFTVAKDQNIRLRTGWFSDRSASYLAAGRPVITQDTGFGDVLPTGEGLFGFQTLDEILAAVDCINADYERHCRVAREIAREHFGHDVVLRQLLADVGM